MKLFIGLTEVSGYYYNLKKGFDELGIPCAYVPLQAHAFKYQENEKLGFLPSLVRLCVTRRVDSAQKNILVRLFWVGAVFASRVTLFIWTIVKFDVFLLGGGSSFFRFFELPLLRLLGKKIIYTFHGTDSRPAYIDGFSEHMTHRGVNNGDAGQGGLVREEVGHRAVKACAKTARRRKRDVAFVEKYADIVVTAPPQAQFHTRPFVIGLAVGIPFVVQRSDPMGEKAGRDANTCILHSPSRFEGKGTAEIRQVIHKLREKGHPIRYIEISGRPNVEVVAAIEECDFVVDQVYSDSPMASFAAEAAFRGKPAVVGGYYCRMICNDLPPELIPPSLFCHPGELEQAVEKLVVDKEFRLRLGEQAQAFVQNHWTARNVADRYLRLAQNDIPGEWIYDPRKNRYVHGMGLNEAKARANVRGIIEGFGRAGLLLAENPDLEERFVQFAYGQAPGAAATV